MEQAVNELYEEVADNLSITVTELKTRLVSGEPLIQRFYEWKYNWDLNDDSTIPF